MEQQKRKNKNKTERKRKQRDRQRHALDTTFCWLKHAFELRVIEVFTVQRPNIHNTHFLVGMQITFLCVIYVKVNTWNWQTGMAIISDDRPILILFPYSFLFRLRFIILIFYVQSMSTSTSTRTSMNKETEWIKYRKLDMWTCASDDYKI